MAKHPRGEALAVQLQALGLFAVALLALARLRGVLAVLRRGRGRQRARGALALHRRRRRGAHGQPAIARSLRAAPSPARIRRLIKPLNRAAARARLLRLGSAAARRAAGRVPVGGLLAVTSRRLDPRRVATVVLERLGEAAGPLRRRSGGAGSLHRLLGSLRGDGAAARGARRPARRGAAEGPAAVGAARAVRVSAGRRGDVAAANQSRRVLLELELAIQLAELLLQHARHAGVRSLGLGEVDVEMSLELRSLHRGGGGWVRVRRRRGRNDRRVEVQVMGTIAFARARKGPRRVPRDHGSRPTRSRALARCDARWGRAGSG